MLITEDFVDLATPTGPMRTHRFMPAAASAGAPAPGLVLFSEIYQVTGPIARTARLLAGQGYLVAAPEVYHEFEPLGTPLPYDKAGTDKGNRYKIEKDLGAYDADARAVIAHLQSLPTCNGRLGAVGICLGGHLAFRCAMNPEIKAAVCFYPTDIHKRSLGKGMNDDSLDRLSQIKGELLLIWGKQDPHIPAEGRALIHHALSAAAVDFTWHEFNAAHAFMRDEGPRYNPALAQICHALVFELFARRLQLNFA
jgi:carboxymethylenebutenolidase